MEYDFEVENTIPELSFEQLQEIFSLKLFEIIMQLEKDKVEVSL